MDDKMHIDKANSPEGDSIAEDVVSHCHLCF